MTEYMVEYLQEDFERFYSLFDAVEYIKEMVKGGVDYNEIRLYKIDEVPFTVSIKVNVDV